MWCCNPERVSRRVYVRCILVYDTPSLSLTYGSAELHLCAVYSVRLRALGDLDPCLLYTSDAADE